MRVGKFLVAAGAISLCLLLAGCKGNLSRRDPQGLARILSHVRFLSSRIGPRPAGSPGDAAAQDYIFDQLNKEGLQASREAFDRVVLPSGTEVAVSTANVLGILPGNSPGTILVGAHHDSRNSACPGASDDASGVAVMLEAARIFAGRTRRHTLVFASFGGEETFGLPGSRQFLKTWNGPPLRMAITLDFVGSGKVFVAPFPVPPELWANRILERAEREARTGLVSFDPWLTIIPRWVPVPHAADHESFLEAGIPALNLSCQFPSWVYHTSEDLPSRVEGETMLATRDLVVRMVAGADGGDLPDKGSDDSSYLPLVLFGHAFFLPRRALLGTAVAVALLGAATLARYRRETVSLAGVGEGLRGALVCLPLTALAVSGPFLVEAALKAINDLQHPWYAHPRLHLIGALLAGSFTLWLALFLSRFLRPTTLPGAYLAPAILVEGAMGAALVALDRPEAAYPFVAGAGAMLLGAWSQFAVRRLALALMGAAALIPFFSPTTYRMILELSGMSFPPHAAALGAGILFFPWFLFLQHLLCTPEALYARAGGPLFRPATGLGLAFLALAASSVNAVRPAYDANHRALVEVIQEIDLQRRRADAVFSSLETLAPVHLDGIRGRKLPSERTASLRVPLPELDLPGLEMEIENISDAESRVWVHGTPPGSPRRVSLRFRSGKKLQVESGGTWRPIEASRWLIFPAGAGVDESFHFRRETSQPLVLESELSYDSDLLGLQANGPFRTFRIEARVHFLKRLL